MKEYCIFFLLSNPVKVLERCSLYKNFTLADKYAHRSLRRPARPRDQFRFEEIAHAGVGDSALAQTEEFTRAAELKVDFGEHEARVVLLHCLESR